MKLSDTLYIREILRRDPDIGVTAVAPVVVDDGAQAPYIAYQRTAIEMAPYKRSGDIESATFDVAVWSDDYDESIHIAERAIELLTAHGVVINTITEGFQNNLFYQNINITLS